MDKARVIALVAGSSSSLGEATGHELAGLGARLAIQR